MRQCWLRPAAGLRRAGVTLASSALLAVSMAGAVAAADPEAGGTVARQWCSSCHIVAPDQVDGADGAPPFTAIAANPALDHGYLTTWLSQSHELMPDFNLTAREVDDLVAYIESLKNE